MTIDILKFIDKHIGEWEHIDVAAQALTSLREALVREMDDDYLGDMFKTEYAVTGTGAFPVDMLRYTSSFPMDESDAAEIENSLDNEPRVGSGQFTVRLVKYHRDAAPTLSDERWWSKFSWKVLNETVHTRAL